MSSLSFEDIFFFFFLFSFFFALYSLLIVHRSLFLTLCSCALCLMSNYYTENFTANSQ